MVPRPKWVLQIVRSEYSSTCSLGGDFDTLPAVRTSSTGNRATERDRRVAARVVTGQAAAYRHIADIASRLACRLERA